jgi:hypothetical protein
MGVWDEFYTDPVGSEQATTPEQPASALMGGDYLDQLAQSTADRTYVPSRNTFMDIASNFSRGGVDLVEMFGGMLDQVNITTGWDEWAKEAPTRYDWLKPDAEEAAGNEGWWTESWKGAVRSAPLTLAPIAVGIGAAAAATATPVLGISAGVAGAATGFASLAGIFGMGTYNKKYRETVGVLGLDKAIELAWTHAISEVGTETLSDAVDVFTGGLLVAPVKAGL